jgi:hypothetical protein
MGNGVPLGALTITGATNTTPIVITTSTVHGVVDVTRVTVAGVGGNLGANGSWIAERTSTTQLKLRGSVGSGAYTSGGTVTPIGTFTKIAELVNLEPIGVTLRMVDVSAHDGNGWSSDIPTHKEGPAMRVTINLVPAHATHDKLTGLIFLALGRIRRDWLIVFPDAGKTTLHMLGYITSHVTVTPVDGVLRATPMLTPDGVVSFSFA